MDLSLSWLDQCRDYAPVSTSSDDDEQRPSSLYAPVRQDSNDVTHLIPGMNEIRADSTKYRNQHVWETSAQPDGELEKELKIACRASLGCGFDDVRVHHKILRFGSKLEVAVHWGMRMLSLFDLLYVPFVASFDYVYPLRSGVTRPIIDMTLTTCYALGVALRFQTSIVPDDLVDEVVSFAEIRSITLRSWTFSMDALALIAAPILYVQPPMGMLCFVRLLKCWRLGFSAQRRMLLNIFSKRALVQIAELFCSILVCIHLYACTWFAAKVISPMGLGREWSAWSGWSRDVFEKQMADYGGLSVPIQPGDANDLLHCYLRAARDGAYMITSWGGPNAMSVSELIVVVIMGPLSGVIMAYIYAIFVTTITRIQQFEVKLNERSAILAACCRQMQLPEDLRFRINRYYSYVAFHHHDRNTQELFSELSDNLMNESRLFRMRDIVCASELFQQLTSSLVLPLLAGCTESVYSPGDIVVRKGEIADRVYIILRGSLVVLSDMIAEKAIATLKEREMFGEICFYSGKKPRTAWVRADSFCVISHLGKDHFDYVMADAPSIKQSVLDSMLRKVRTYRRETISMLPEDMIAAVDSAECRHWASEGYASEETAISISQLESRIPSRKETRVATATGEVVEHASDSSALWTSATQETRSPLPSIRQGERVTAAGEVVEHAIGGSARSGFVADAQRLLQDTPAPYTQETVNAWQAECLEDTSQNQFAAPPEAAPARATDMQLLRAGLCQQERAMTELQGQMSAMAQQLSRLEEMQLHIASALGVVAPHRQPDLQDAVHEGPELVQAPGG